MNKNEFRQLLSRQVLILDGAMGTELQKRGYLDSIGAPEELNLVCPERIQEIYKEYLEAGTQAILTNTFGANRLKLKDYKLEDRLEEINVKAVRLARAAAEKYKALIAADVGPLGSYIKPLGAISFDDAYDIFSEQIRALAKENPDYLVIETMAEIREMKAALLAAKDNFDGPIVVQMTFTADGTTVTGTGLHSFIAVAESMGADAVGMNCSVGPDELAKLVKIISANTSLPISFKPNAGMPKLVNKQTIFPGTPDEFLNASLAAYSYGANLLGGCCGTTPEFIALLAGKLKNKPPADRHCKRHFFVSSRTTAFDIADRKDIITIGERINPTNRKKFQEELLAGNFATLRREAKEQAAAGADTLDINLGIPGADELKLMQKAVEEIQEAVSAPLCLDSSRPDVLERGLRACAGKPIINSVNGETAKLDIVLPLAKRYGAALIALTTDENGLPKNAAERLIIAERIINRAAELGFPPEELILDYLTLSVSAMPDQAVETLNAIKQSKKRWPDIKTVLGLSNISFGMPARQKINSTFLKLAAEAGVDMAILNPFEKWDIDDQFAKDLLTGRDAGGKLYMKAYSGFVKKADEKKVLDKTPQEMLFDCVVDGNREEIASAVKLLISNGINPVDIANEILLKALNLVGERFNNKEYFLPQVILSAEAAQIAFSHIKPLLLKEPGFGFGKAVIATVKGDVHDIGKNIVGAVLESHGWGVIDLGKNVAARGIVEAAKENNAKLIGLSALMTSTMPEMENVIKLVKQEKLDIKVMIGGAPVTERYSKEIGADGYGRDAIEAAKTAKSLTSK